MAVLYPGPPGMWVLPQSGSDDPAYPDVVAPRVSPARLVTFLRADHWFPQLIRFALVGGLSNIGYFLLFLVCYSGGPQLANLTGSVVSTALANELHRRLTFHASDRVNWLTAQLEGGGLALAGLAITSAALAILDVAAPTLNNITEAIAVIAITAAVGTLRFLTLRLWVF